MKILLLAGTGEAKELARALMDKGHYVIASLAGATRAPKPIGSEMRVGGFGKGGGFIDWLEANQPDAVIDATHPFAARISARSAFICRDLGVPYLQLLRPPWVPDAGKSQYQIAQAKHARKFIGKGARVFLATGRSTLEQFAVLPDCYLICRQIDPPEAPFPLENGEYLVGRPPFSVADEVALFEDLRIDWLVVKNAGGQASYSKIEAAAQLGIPVLMLKRPLAPKGPHAVNVEQALAWVDRHADH